MGIFSGIGGAYVAQGLAQGMQQAPITQRMLEDRARLQSMQDQELQMQREDRANRLAQQQRQNAREDVSDARAGQTFQQEQALRAHGLARLPVEDTQHDSTFGMQQKLQQGAIDNLPLQRQHMQAQIGLAGAQAAAAGADTKFRGIQGDALSMNLESARLGVGADRARAQAESENNPQALLDFSMQHGLVPDGHILGYTPDVKGTGFTVDHYQPGNGTQPPQLINQQHFDNLDQAGQKLDDLLHPDHLRQMETYGLRQRPTNRLYISDSGVPIVDHNNGQLTTADGQPYDARKHGMLHTPEPQSSGTIADLLNPNHGAGGPRAATNPGSGFINNALNAGQPQQAAPGANTNWLDNYVGGNENSP